MTGFSDFQISLGAKWLQSAAVTLRRGPRALQLSSIPQLRPITIYEPAEVPFDIAARSSPDLHRGVVNLRYESGVVAVLGCVLVAAATKTITSHRWAIGSSRGLPSSG